MTDLNATQGTMTSGQTGAYGAAPANPGNGNDGVAQSDSIRASFASGGGTLTFYWIADLGSAEYVDVMTVYGPDNAAYDWEAGIEVARSADAVAWEVVTLTETIDTGTYAEGFTGGADRARHTYTFDDTERARYWRLQQTVTGSGFKSHLGMSAWLINEGTAPPGPPDGEPAGPPSELPVKEDDPGAAILEVYVIEATAPRWDVALWDDSYVWGEGGWMDITPQGIVADIRWGADQAHHGILASTRAATWTVTTHDPERVLDPANAEGPAYPQVVPFLPIRLRHRAATIRTGYLESIEYDYRTDRGLLRATDAIGRMSAATVPPDQVPFLATQLHARARDAIAAAGLDIAVPEGNAPWGPVELAPLADGTYTVWAIIAASAQEALYVPYLDKDERLRFRPYAYPNSRGTRIEQDELVDLTVRMDHDGLYSAVALTDYSDSSTEIVHAITPTPAYGKRVYDRNPALTIEGADWADAVLADRGAPSVRLVPGRIRPLTATRVETFAKLLQMESVAIAHELATPAVEAQARVLGLRVRVESFGPARLHWEWTLDTASAGVGPLIADYLGELPPIDYLVDDADGEYLYPDGVLVTEPL